MTGAPVVFGGYATSRKHTVFSRLALNSYRFIIMFKGVYLWQKEVDSAAVCLLI